MRARSPSQPWFRHLRQQLGRFRNLAFLVFLLANLDLGSRAIALEESSPATIAIIPKP